MMELTSQIPCGGFYHLPVGVNNGLHRLILASQREALGAEGVGDGLPDDLRPLFTLVHGAALNLPFVVREEAGGSRSLRDVAFLQILWHCLGFPLCRVYWRECRRENRPTNI